MQILGWGLNGENGTYTYHHHSAYIPPTAGHGPPLTVKVCTAVPT